jgi:hypothetical protein
LKVNTYFIRFKPIALPLSQSSLFYNLFQSLFFRY